ncbi:MAG: hypothetical protein K6G46_07670, partial [Prevotella sp.]|nr:hypothetical protein [Prevotella sp.]
NYVRQSHQDMNMNAHGNMETKKKLAKWLKNKSSTARHVGYITICIAKKHIALSVELSIM